MSKPTPGDKVVSIGYFCCLGVKFFAVFLVFLANFLKSLKIYFVQEILGDIRKKLLKKLERFYDKSIK